MSFQRCTFLFLKHKSYTGLFSCVLHLMVKFDLKQNWLHVHAHNHILPSKKKVISRWSAKIHCEDSERILPIVCSPHLLVKSQFKEKGNAQVEHYCIYIRV